MVVDVNLWLIVLFLDSNERCKMEKEVVNVCRLCRGANDVLLSDIFNDVSAEDSVVSKIWNCLSLKVTM